MIEDKGLYLIRDMKEEDKNLIFSTWLKGLYYGDSWFSQIPKNIFMNSYKQVIIRAMTDPAISIRVACLKDDLDVVIGYSVLSKDGKAIVWCFVKSPWRKQGIGRALLPQSPQYATLLTTLGKELIKKVPGLVFNPFY